MSLKAFKAGRQSPRLPDRFPVGTRYVVEGRAGRISLHYLEFPDGRRIDLPADPATWPVARRLFDRNRAAPKKYSKGEGTPKRMAS
jgi:hypothetical protein